MRDTLQEHVERMELEEFAARTFAALGVMFWITVAGAALITGSTQAFYGFALVALAATGLLVVGWFFERTAAVAAVLLAVATVAWGISLAWEAGLWIIVGATLVVPFLITAALFLAVRHEERVVEDVENGIPIRGAHA